MGMVFVTSPAWLMILVVVMVVVVATMSSRRRKRYERQWDVRVCARCGQSQPPHATFCRQCGERL